MFPIIRYSPFSPPIYFYIKIKCLRYPIFFIILPVFRYFAGISIFYRYSDILHPRNDHDIVESIVNDFWLDNYNKNKKHTSNLKCIDK